ncbi:MULTISPECIES: ArsR/SmtB family transcription factor [unclassified Ornithinimicrobium]|uniref:ArsR/SmtB family transcription factor n=1 Tax=unclassified Ornithinimicrobium TaxID=2615080 RepID=UPI00385321DC
MNAATASTHSPAGVPRLLSALCCAPLLAAELSEDDADFLARALRTLGDPVRLRILGRIRTRPAAETTTSDLSHHLGLTQPTVSHHLGTLHEMGFLTRRRAGRQTWYRIEPAAFESLQQLLDPAPTEATATFSSPSRDSPA